MKTSTSVWITTQFEAFHRWKDAPAPVAFLRFFHRHTFGVKVSVFVDHDNRDVEFFQLKSRVNLLLAEHWAGQKFEQSCEHIAKDLIERLSKDYAVDYVSVDEDGENGATVTVEDDTYPDDDDPLFNWEEA